MPEFRRAQERSLDFPQAHCTTVPQMRPKGHVRCQIDKGVQSGSALLGGTDRVEVQAA